MRKFALIFIALLLAAPVLTSCLSNDDEQNVWEEYAAWREANEAWLEEMTLRTDDNGDPYYKTVRGAWDYYSYVLIHYYNDTTITRGNLSPHYTSTVDVIYRGHLYDGTPFDSSYLNTSPADSVYRTGLEDVITGWVVALSDMHVGDSCEVIIPYQSGYNANGSGAVLPYSCLVFDMKLVGVPFYETHL